MTESIQIAKDGDRILPAPPVPAPSVMLPPKQELSAGRGPSHVDLRDIPHKWFQVLAMHMANYSTAEISDEVGYTAQTIYRILHDDRIKILRMQYLELYEMEFLNYYPKFTSTVASLMSSLDEKSQASGAALFSKHLGMIKKSNEAASGTQINLSAEEIVFNILNQSS